MNLVFITSTQRLCRRETTAWRLIVFSVYIYIYIDSSSHSLQIENDAIIINIDCFLSVDYPHRESLCWREFTHE